MSKDWSEYQKAVFEHVGKNPKRNLIVEAKPGSGKTTTIVEATRRVPSGKRILMCAFNVKIRDELQSRVDGRVAVRTFHQLGYYAVQRAWGRLEINKYRQRDLVRSVLPDKKRIGTAAFSDVTKMVSMAMARLATTDDEFREIMYAYDCAPIAATREQEQQYIGWAKRVMELTREKSLEISFDDQVYLPAALDLTGSKFDYVFVDEAQDCNPAQLKIIQNALIPGGKIVAVGDRRQAIYSFRGADPFVMDDLTGKLQADVLPLSITYRCPRRVVSLVNRIVPDLEPGPEAIDGSVQITTEKMFLDGVRPGDIVISRTNAAIAKYSMLLLQAGKRCTILGRDISSGLLKLIDKAEASSITSMLKYLDGYSKEECERLVAARKEDKAEVLLDQIDALRGLSEGLTNVDGLRKRIDDLFGDDEGDNAIIFSTVHKAKGLEFDRVWMFETTFNVSTTEGENLYYVAATRSKSELYLVQVPRKDKKPPQSISERWRLEKAETD